MKTTIVCLGDTHDNHRDIKVPDGDVLIHVGDVINGHRRNDEDISLSAFIDTYMDFNDWMGELPHKHKLFVPGNHDFVLQMVNGLIDKLDNFKTLIDEETIINDIVFYGTPWQPIFGSGWGYNLPKDKLEEKYKKISYNTDVLITHNPTYKYGDESYFYGFKEHGGCPILYKEVENVQPLYHVFGHFHESNGVYRGKDFNTTFINCAIGYKFNKNAPFSFAI